MQALIALSSSVVRVIRRCFPLSPAAATLLALSLLAAQ